VGEEDGRHETKEENKKTPNNNISYRYYEKGSLRVRNGYDIGADKTYKLRNVFLSRVQKYYVRTGGRIKQYA